MLRNAQLPPFLLEGIDEPVPSSLIILSNDAGLTEWTNHLDHDDLLIMCNLFSEFLSALKTKKKKKNNVRTVNRKS